MDSMRLNRSVTPERSSLAKAEFFHGLANLANNENIDPVGLVYDLASILATLCVTGANLMVLL